MLSAIPKTQLYNRLAKEGRLDPSDNPSCGTNVRPLRMSSETLRRGYIQLMADLYEPNSFFDRLDELWLNGPLVTEPGWRSFAENHLWARIRKHTRSWLETTALTVRMMVQIGDHGLRQIYFDRIIAAMRRRPDGVLLRLYTIRCAMHFHFYQLAARLQSDDKPIINTY